MKLKISFSNIYIMFFLFWFIYFPPLFPVNVLHILFLIASYGLFAKRSGRAYWRFTSKNRIFNSKIMIPFFAIAFYILILSSLYGKPNLNNTYSYLVFSVEIPIIACYIAKWFEQKNKNMIEIISILVKVGIVQAIFAIVCYFNEGIHTQIIQVMVNNGLAAVGARLTGFRMYGLACSLTSTTPVIQAVLAICAIYLGFLYKKRYMFYSIALIFSAVINARSAILILAVGFFVLLAQLMRKKYLKYVLGVIGIIIIMIVCISTINWEINSNLQWIKSGLDEISMFFKGNNVGYFDYLFNEALIWPTDNLIRIFGSGNNIFKGITFRTDVGYVNDVWMIGIPLSIVSYLLIVRYIMQMRGARGKINTFLTYYLIFIFFLYNFKTSIIGNNDLMNVIILLVICSKNNLYRKKSGIINQGVV